MHSEKRLSLNIVRKFFITNSLAAQAEQDRRFLQEELLRQQQDFREIHQQDLIKMKELQKFQNSTLMSSPSRSSSRIRRLLWNYLEDFKNYRMK